MVEFLALLMVLALFAGLVSGFPVAFVLAGVSLWFALIGQAFDLFSMSYLAALPGRLYGIMTNDLLIAVPLFVFMGVTLERSKIAEELLETMAALCGGLRGGLGISVLLVGALLAASTGIVGATVVTMGLISLPTMLRAGYCRQLSCGTICAAGTLGQIIPPSIVLILLGDQISNAWQSAQMQAGNVSPVPVTIADLFVGALIPGLVLVLLYAVWLALNAIFSQQKLPAMPQEQRAQVFEKGMLRPVLHALLPPLVLILLVLGSILGGVATATESAAVGGVGALALAAARGMLTFDMLRSVCQSTAKVSSMIFTILIGATFFTLVFRGYGGEEMIANILQDLPGGLPLAMLLVMVVVFLLGFMLDFIEIIFIVVPIVAPALLMMGADPVWLAIMLAINLQTSFLTPPFGFSLFYLRGVAPQEVKTTQIYQGVLPFIVIQLFMLGTLSVLPQLATHLPEVIYGTEFTSLEMKEGSAESIIAPTWAIDY